MPSVTVTSATLRPHLEKCGYIGDRLEQNYSFGAGSVALAGFIGKPWDVRSACLATVDATTDSRLAAHACIELGAPTVLVCTGESLDWWQLSISGPKNPTTIRASEIPAFFEKHGSQLKPENIYAAKLRRPVGSGIQMQFVDAGLMPALERRAGEALNRLVSQAVRTLTDVLGNKVRTRTDQEGVYKSVFWLLAAKLLCEKGVRKFKFIDLKNIDQVFSVVGEHYKDAADYPPGDKTWKPAISQVAGSIADWGRLGNISAESLAYLYETALVDPLNGKKHATLKHPHDNVRKILGIHSTPSVLVDHMLSQIWPLVDSESIRDQRVFEPACGHAAFLTAAMRDISNWSEMEDSAERHRYLRDRIRGIEVDPFAVEIAKLSLTLADVPHGNTWRIEPVDMFTPGLLRKEAKWATIVLSNPPYETFNKTYALKYENTNDPVTAQTKAVEMLNRVIPNLAPSAVFGFVLPQGTLFDKEAKSFRDGLLATCEVAEISLFEDKLFRMAKPEACILIGRRKSEKSPISSVMYRRVRNRDMEAFKSSLAFSREDVLKPSQLGRGKENSLYEPDLRAIWKYTASMPLLGAEFDVQQGFQIKAKHDLSSRNVVNRTPKAGFTKAVLKASDDYPVWRLPNAHWVSLRPGDVRRLGAATVLRQQQVVINYAGPVQAWRFRPVVDAEGIAVSSRFLVFRPNPSAKHSLLSLWAVLLSPIANAYAYSWSGKRQTLAREWLNMPLPEPTPAQRSEIEAAAEAYLRIVVPPREFMLALPEEEAIKRSLLQIDAAVLRLYDLPLGLERQLLGIFDDVDRPGVGCSFRGYPPTWSSSPMKSTFNLSADPRPIWERIADLAASIPEDAIAGLPSDGASQLDHYLYGASKRNS